MADHRRMRAAVITAALCLLAGGCATIPTSGPVQAGRGAATSDRPPGVHVYAQPPRDGWSPSQVVSGFLSAMASTQQNHAVARAYLTPDIRNRWPNQNAPAVVVYAQDENYRLEVGRENTVSVAASQKGTISRSGEYRPSPQGATMHAVFRLQRVNGQWRIGSLPGSLLLTASDAVSAYVPFDLYYFSQDRKTLVPDPIVLSSADADSWPDELVERLLAGSTSSVADGVVSAIPAHTRLESAPVLDDQGTLTVHLGGAASALSGAARQRMNAQITATLLRVQGVSRVRVQTSDKGNAPAHGPGVHRPYDPPRWVHNVSGYLIRKHKLVRVATGSGDVTRLRGPFGTGAVRFRDPAVSLDAQHAAALSRDGHILYVGPLDQPGKAAAVYHGTNLTPASWDRTGALWVVDNTHHGPRVLVFRDGGGAPIRVHAPGLRGSKVARVRVAWDGTRIAFVTSKGKGRRRLLVGTIVRGDKDETQTISVTSLRNIAPTLTDVKDVWWYDESSLTVLGREQSDLLDTYIVAVDGLSVNVASSISHLRDVAAAPGQPLLVTNQQGQVSISQPEQFNTRSIGAGTDPAFPG